MVSFATETMGIGNREAVAPSPPDGEEGEVDTQQLKEILGFVLRAPRRRPVLAIVAFGLTLGLGFFIATFWPRSYGSRMRILAQHNLVLPALDNPSRSVPREADNPTKNAADTIMKRDNIVALMKQLDIIDRWQATRQPILHLKDQISLAISGPRPEEERFLDLVGLLEKRLTVATDESSITVSIEWPDRQMAFDIMSLVQKNFLEARYDSNVSVIEEAIRILEERAKPQSKEVEVALEELSKLDAERKSSLPPAAGGASVRSPATPSSPTAPQGPATAQPSDAASDAASRLEEVRRHIRELEDVNRRHLAEAQNQLADARTTLGPLHPTVIALHDKIEQLSAPPPELATLRASERELVARVAKGLEAPAQPAPRAQTSGAPATAPTPAPAVDEVSTPRRSVDRLSQLDRDDPPTALARSKLQAASAKYNELLSRIESANIELEVTRASFKYQYTIVTPPELARKPSKPNVTLVMIGSFLLALILMVLVPAGLDLWRGRFVEAWQIERRLKLPVLGELLPPHL
jgi:uncharacterized protein involved in exopolysaccharide biosynthesis